MHTSLFFCRQAYQRDSRRCNILRRCAQCHPLRRLLNLNMRMACWWQKACFCNDVHNVVVCDAIPACVQLADKRMTAILSFCFRYRGTYGHKGSYSLRPWRVGMSARHISVSVMFLCLFNFRSKERGLRIWQLHVAVSNDEICNFLMNFIVSRFCEGDFFYHKCRLTVCLQTSVIFGFHARLAPLTASCCSFKRWNLKLSDEFHRFAVLRRWLCFS